MAPLSPAAQRVQDALAAQGLSCRVVELPVSTRTALEAAQAVDCELGQIVKSIVFRGERSGRPILVLVSGTNRVDEKRLADLVAEPVSKADAEFVRERTGFAIGGVPPVGLAGPMDVLVDCDLLAHPEVWSAAGTPRAVFKLPPADLVRIAGGRVAAVKPPAG